MADDKYRPMSSSTTESIYRDSSFSGLSDEGYSDNQDSCDYSTVISFMENNNDGELDNQTIKEDDSDIDPSPQTPKSSIKKRPKKSNRLVSIHEGKLSTPLDQIDSSPSTIPMKFTLRMQQQKASNMRYMTNSPTNSEKPYYKYTITDIPSSPTSFISTFNDTEMETYPESETVIDTNSMLSSSRHHSLLSHQSQSTPTSQCSTLIFPTPPDSIPRNAFADLTRASSKSTPQHGIDAGCIMDEELLSPSSHLSSNSTTSSFVCFTIGKEYNRNRESSGSKLKSNPTNQIAPQIHSQDQDTIREEGTIHQPTIINRTVHPGASNFSLPWTQHSTQSHSRINGSSSAPTNYNTKIKAIGPFTYFRPMIAYLSLDAFLFVLLSASIVMFVFLRTQNMDFSSSLVFLIASILLILIEILALSIACRFTYVHMRKRHDYPIPIAIAR